MIHPIKPSRSTRLSLRGLDHRVLEWGDVAAPKLFMLHGWMDAAASFQFLVDALEGQWHVIAPDLRGFGESAWQPQGYWFADYLADLEALLDVYAPGEAVDLVGHSLGGNVVMQYAGVRPERVRRLVSLEGFGIPAEPADKAPKKLARWLDALRQPPVFRPYATLEAVADRLQANNPRLTRERALFLAPSWAETRPDGTAMLRADPRHKMPFPSVYRMEEIEAVWHRITCPVLWVAASESEIPAWLGDHPEGEAATDSLAGVRRRLAHVPNGELLIIDGAGHMLHHDQPVAVAAAIEPFLERADR